MKHTSIAMLTLSLLAHGSLIARINLDDYAVHPAIKALLDAHSDEVNHKI